MYCDYFQAHIPPASCFFVLAVLKSYDHMAFARTFDVNASIIEFFVAPTATPYFIELMAVFERRKYVFNLVQLQNRLAKEGE